MINEILLLFSFIIFISTLMVILSNNPIHSIYWLVFIFLLASISLIIIGFNFIGFILIIVYIGAITILFLFVIMMLDILDIKVSTNIMHIIFMILIIINLIILNYYCVLGTFEHKKILKSFDYTWEIQALNHLEIIGLSIYNNYFISFIILSMVLLIGLISAIILTLDINLKTKKQILYSQHQRNK